MRGRCPIQAAGLGLDVREQAGRGQLEREMTRLAESTEELQLSIERLSAWAARLRDELGRQAE